MTKRAVEITRDKYSKLVPRPAELIKVDLDSVMSALDEMQNSNTVKVLKSLRKMERLVIIALYLTCQGNNQEKVLFESVLSRALNMLQKLKDGALRVRPGLDED
jgi:Cdc6-like AAA superfamily ATPase